MKTDTIGQDEVSSHSGFFFATVLGVILLLLFGTGQAVASTVENLSDSGAGSLRHQIAIGVDHGVVNFDQALNGQTITLTSGEININKSFTIDASNLPDGITISAGENSRAFRISVLGSLVSFTNVTITDGLVPEGSDGGGIINSGWLTMENCTISNCTAGAGTETIDGSNGGGIFNHAGARLTLRGSTLSNCRAGSAVFYDEYSFTRGLTGRRGGDGGAIYNLGTLELANSTIDNCHAGDGNTGADGGAIFSTGTTAITDSTLSNNRAGTAFASTFNDSSRKGGDGGAIYNSGTCDLLRVEISGNIAGVSDFKGGSGGGSLHLWHSHTDRLEREK